MIISRESIEDIVKNGLVQDIFKMERAYELLKTIGEESAEIHSRELKVYDELFGTFQSALQVEAILAVARIYDTPSKKYPTRCLLGVLEYLNSNINNLPNIRQPYQLALHLKNMNAPMDLIEIAEKGSNEFAARFCQYVNFLLCEPERLIALEKLKQIRDKSFAHNESIEEIYGPTWGSLIDLINICKNVVGVLGWAYFSTAYVIDGEYILTKDSYRPKRALDKLFNQLNVNKKSS